jgi:hypothetical protein
LKTEEIKNTANTAAKAAIELYENRKATYDALKGTKQQAGTCKKLSKCSKPITSHKSWLALVVFPEPIISDLLGTSLIAAGAIQQGIKRQSIYIDDLPKALKSAIEEVKASKELI